MSNFIKNLFENDESVPVSKIFFSLLGIALIRAFFENFSSSLPSGYFFSWRDSYLEFPLYFMSVFLSFALLLYFFTKKSFNKIVNFETRLFLLVLLPPIADLIITSGKGAQMAYVLTEPQNILPSFFQALNPLGFFGLTFGIHLAAFFIFLALAMFIFNATKSVVRSIFGSLAGYCMLFVYAILPSLVAMPYHLQNKFMSAAEAYQETLRQSWIVTTSTQTFFTFNSFLFQNETTTRIFFLLIVSQIVMLAAIFKPEFLAAIKKNLRPERILYWFCIAAIGILLNDRMVGTLNLANAINIISLGVFFLLIALHIWLAVCVNDNEDIEIDEISNPERPLAKKTVSLSEWKDFQMILFILVFFGTAIMNQTVAFLMALFQATYYLYSAKPLRLKKHFISSSVLIGTGSAAIAMAGFFLVSPDQHVLAFPIKAIFIIGISYGLISNLKDIKDFEGDKHAGIMTMPAVFGLKNSKIIISLLCATVLIGVPLILRAYPMLFFSVCISLFLIYLFNKKKYQEKYIFLALFLYLLTFFFVSA